MAYKYTYPVVDRALRNFLVFILVLMIVVGVGALGAGLDLFDLPLLVDVDLGEYDITVQ